ncbi:hypothetical protein VNO78_05980 [Psophocarpus tetragonolobus]|uniref:B box-type domain-containing protein n=1 Tax=Psophocarpus tetragonolobus TaxID=3891 RepID=A0AAN9SUE8_PSOTE
MCKGAEEKKLGALCRSFQHEEITSLASTRGSTTSCELCGLQASLYCQADNAYLCRKCDKWVHKANILALRHVRCFLCNTCQNLTQRYMIGVSMEIVVPSTVGWIVQKQEQNPDDNNTDRYSSRTINCPYTFL